MQGAVQPPPTPDVPTAAVERMAAAFADLGNATRLSLLLRLAAGPKTVSELAAEAAVKQPTVSMHLHRLHAAGWLHQVRNGKHVRNSLHDGTVKELVDLAAEIARRRVLRTCGCFARSAGV